MNTKDPFNDPLVKSVREVISEQESSPILSPQGASIALNYVDISDPFNPRVVFKGAGSMPYNMRHKDIGKRLHDLGTYVASGKVNMDTMAFQIFGAKNTFTSGNLTMYYMIGYAEAEAVLQTPQAKAKITKAKKAKQQGK